MAARPRWLRVAFVGRDDRAVADQDADGPGRHQRHQGAGVGPAPPGPGAGHDGGGHRRPRRSRPRPACCGADLAGHHRRDQRRHEQHHPVQLQDRAAPGPRRPGLAGRPRQADPLDPDQQRHGGQAGEVVVRLGDRPEAEHHQVADRPPPGEPDRGPIGPPAQPGTAGAPPSSRRRPRAPSSRASRPPGSRDAGDAPIPAVPVFWPISRYQTRSGVRVVQQDRDRPAQRQQRRTGAGPRPSARRPQPRREAARRSPGKAPSVSATRTRMIGPLLRNPSPIAA